MHDRLNVDHRIDGYNMRTVMMEAAFNRNTAACAALLRKKANPNSRAKFGRTALHIAAINFSSDVAKLLVQAKADPTIRDKFKRTPLDVARAKFAVNELLIAEKERVGISVPMHFLLIRCRYCNCKDS